MMTISKAYERTVQEKFAEILPEALKGVRAEFLSKTGVVLARADANTDGTFRAKVEFPGTFARVALYRGEEMMDEFRMGDHPLVMGGEVCLTLTPVIGAQMITSG